MKLFLHACALVIEAVGTLFIWLDTFRLGELALTIGFADSPGNVPERFHAWYFHAATLGFAMLLVGVLVSATILWLEHRVHVRRNSAQSEGWAAGWSSRRIWQTISANSDLVIFIALALGAYLLIRFPPFRDGDSTAVLAGALFGGAALLLGNWINRWNEKKRNLADAGSRVSKIKTLVTARLVAVSLKLISAKAMADAAYESSAQVSPGELGALPEGTGLLKDLGTEILALDYEQIDALETLDTNLKISGQQLRDSSGGFLTVIVIAKGLGFTMEMAAKCFECIAPDRKLELPTKPSELASAILRREAKFPGE